MEQQQPGNWDRMPKESFAAVVPPWQLPLRLHVGTLLARPWHNLPNFPARHGELEDRPWQEEGWLLEPKTKWALVELLPK